MTIYIMALVEFATFPSDKVSSLSSSRGESDPIQRFVKRLAELRLLQTDCSCPQLFYVRHCRAGDGNTAVHSRSR